MKYVVFEGADGTGKSTIAKRVYQALQQSGLFTNPERLKYMREPEGRLRAEIMRDDTLDTTELLLFFADRYQQLSNLEENTVIISDRSFISSYVYQIEQKGVADVQLFDDLMKLGELPKIDKMFVVSSEKRLGEKSNRLDDVNRDELVALYSTMKGDKFIERYVKEIVEVENQEGGLKEIINLCALSVLETLVEEV